MPESSATPGAAPARPPRFSWPMRLFLAFVLFDMVFHSFAEALTPYPDWLGEFDLSRYPKRLPTWKEVETLRDKAAPAAPDPVWARYEETLHALPTYFNPVPAEKTQDKLEDAGAWARYIVSWVTSRLGFFERLLGLEQEWTMFSPGVGGASVVPRLQLLFADGTRVEVRLLCDPPDLTRYARWLEVKLLDSEWKMVDDVDFRLGYCNYIAHQYQHNEAGAALTAIYIYKIVYVPPQPDEDAHAILHAQNGPPDWEGAGPTWAYHVADRDLFTLSPGLSRDAQDKLDAAQPLGVTSPPY